MISTKLMPYEIENVARTLKMSSSQIRDWLSRGVLSSRKILGKTTLDAQSLSLLCFRRKLRESGLFNRQLGDFIFSAKDARTKIHERDFEKLWFFYFPDYWGFAFDPPMAFSVEQKIWSPKFLLLEYEIEFLRWADRDATKLRTLQGKIHREYESMERILSEENLRNRKTDYDLFMTVHKNSKHTSAFQEDLLLERKFHVKHSIFLEKYECWEELQDLKLIKVKKRTVEITDEKLVLCHIYITLKLLVGEEMATRKIKQLVKKMRDLDIAFGRTRISIIGGGFIFENTEARDKNLISFFKRDAINSLSLLGDCVSLMRHSSLG